MNYTLHQLHVFTKVVQLKSITKAAEELHMTQPAVSIQLKNLQDQFDILLTEVIGRQLYVTDFGLEVYKMAELIVTEVNAINYKTMSYKGHLTGRLLISTVSTGVYVMPHFLTGFIKTNEGVDLVMDVSNQSKVINSLRNNEIDFALVSVLPEDLKINEEVLLDNELVVVGNNNQKRGKKNSVKNEIASMPLIFREEGSSVRYVMEQHLKKHNIKAQKKMELTSNEAVKQAVVAGLGNSILPLIGIRNELMNSELKIIPTAGFPIKSTWRLIWLKKKKLSPVAEAYLEHLRKNKEQVIKEQFGWMDKIHA